MLRLTVIGMTCDHCVATVARAVRALPGAGAVSVDLGSGMVAVQGNPDKDAVRAAITAAGYTVAA
jgi:copper chaperone CopZ